MSEADLLRSVLTAPVFSADIEVLQAQATAEGAATPLLRSPALALRHEDARGAWGATTKAVGGSVTLDLGLSSLPSTRAGQLRAEAGQHRRAALALELGCELRREATELWAASRSARVSQAAQERLEELLRALTVMGEAGESSGYARDLTALSVDAHQAGVQERADRAEIPERAEA